MELYYKLDDRPPLVKSFILGFQHLLSALPGIIGAPLVVASALGFSIQETVILVNASMLMSGIGSMIQGLGFAPLKLGAKLPVIQGTSFAFVGVSITIGFQYGFAAVVGATIVGGLFEVFLSFYIHRIRKFFPPVVTGTVVCLIGMTIFPVAVDWLAGGKGAEDYGSLMYLGVGGVVFLLVVFFNQWFKGFISSASILIGLIFGYLLWFALGLLDLSPVTEAAVVAIPNPLHFGIEFHTGAIIAICVVYTVSMVESVGDYLALSNYCDTELDSKRLSAGIRCEGLNSALAGVFNSMATTSFSQNIGVVGITGVASRYVVVFSGGILIAAGLLPKFGALIVSVPEPVIGGAGVIMFGMILAGGIGILKKIDFSRRNTMVLALGIAAGLTVTYRPEIVNELPDLVRMVCGNGVALGAIVTVIANLVLPESKTVKEALNAVSES
ncbi:purine permease [Endozoicomonas gorgoniicola]|uniref:Purine permease n=1 Tax=Endozoicomonas gorgoniicola TaxID=1234144 RepID=A0ABT3MP68_9GAMM|nr:nucleobase:cation symporter-2 family protein [Endozoicomonas gorgoniicola]MCW7551170.1 purine permease [Endozoicomonas gorgoniicola]